MSSPTGTNDAMNRIALRAYGAIVDYSDSAELHAWIVDLKVSH